jgi:putative SOS response-associated peptidase YedK
MCGRFSLTATPEDIEALFGLDAVEAFPPRYNIAPTQPILMIASAGLTEPGSNRPDRKAVLVRWGLIPSWAKDPKDLPLLINARSETAAEKASFRAAMKRRRTLVPASGFYEWRRAGEKKSQPFWVPPSSGGIVAFGALMETWHSPDGSEIDTGAILTTAANAEIAPIHDRMPLVIEPGDWTRWLDPLAENPCDIADLVHPAPDRTFAPMAVSDKVNKVANVGADLQEPIQGVPTPKPAGSKPGGSRQGSLF